MKLIFGAVHGFLMLSTFLVATDFYNPDFIRVPIPDILYQVVLIGVPGISLVWALGHVVIAGGLFAISSGGSSLLEGLGSGAIIGFGMAVGRLWPYAMCWALGAFFTAQSFWHAPLAFIAGTIFFGIERMVKYIWGRVDSVS